jgi:Cu/Ag efflux pump CusA
MNVSGGKILSPDKRYTLRTRGEFASLDDIRNVIVTVRNAHRFICAMWPVCTSAGRSD